jgi:hypothetical protein
VLRRKRKGARRPVRKPAFGISLAALEGILQQGRDRAEPYQILLVTDPGSGRIVAQALNDSAWEDVVGTVDGDSSVLILTENLFFQRAVHSKLKHYLSEGDENAVVEMG